MIYAMQTNRNVRSFLLFGIYAVAIFLISGLMGACAESGLGRSRLDGNGSQNMPTADSEPVLPPWEVVRERKSLLQKESLSPILEAACLRAEIACLADQILPMPYYPEKKEEQQRLREEIKPLVQRSNDVEAKPLVKIAVLKYVTRLPDPATFSNDLLYAHVFTWALEERQRTASVSWQECMSILDMIRKSSSPYRKEVFINLAWASDYRFVEYVAGTLSESMEEWEYDWMRWLMQDAEHLIPDNKGMERKTWIELSNDLRGKVVWRGAWNVNLHEDKGGLQDAEAKSFYDISWESLYLNKNVWAANGRFQSPLTPAEKEQFRTFMEMPLEKRREAAISAYQRRKQR